ncbi:MAG: hypothetical protein PHC28_09320 [Flavobacterium sp.]|uniref:hypothetical protein n=1 Tax=Flavobacterium sp. TaxID=239 RepID=UPI0026367BBA|nr:hypothetical protein [Flavobacterium sp.]MDD5150669.1 hypothetical protein [Flavobacterium sp.]
MIPIVQEFPSLKHLWVNSGNFPIDIIGGKHAKNFGTGANIGNGTYGRCFSRTSANYDNTGFYTDSGVITTIGSEFTTFCLFELTTISINEEPLLRLDDNATDYSNFCISMSFIPSSRNIRCVINDTGGNGWQTGQFFTYSDSFLTNRLYLSILRWKTTYPIDTSIKILGEPCSFQHSNYTVPIGTVRADYQLGAQFHIGGMGYAGSFPFSGYIYVSGLFTKWLNDQESNNLSLYLKDNLDFYTNF